MEKLTYRELTEVIAQMSARLNEIEMYLAGVVALLGREEILQAAKDSAEQNAREVDAILAKQVASGVEAGWLKPSKVSGLKSVVVGYETIPGQPTRRMQIVPEGLSPKDRGNYIGRTAGEEFVVQNPAGPVMTKVTEVYEVDEARRREVRAEAEAKAKAKADVEAKAEVEAKAHFGTSPPAEDPLV